MPKVGYRPAWVGTGSPGLTVNNVPASVVLSAEPRLLNCAESKMSRFNLSAWAVAHPSLIFFLIVIVLDQHDGLGVWEAAIGQIF